MNYLGSSLIEAAKITAEVVHPCEMDAGLVRDWQGLRDGRSCYDSAFYAPQFTIAVGGVRKDARIAVYRANGETIGILPFHLVRRRIAKPIAGHINDYHGAILKRGFDHGDPRLLEAAGLDAYDFNHLPGALGARAGMTRANGSSPQMELAVGYGAYLEQRPASFGRGYSAMKRKLRKLEREIGPVTFEFDSSDPAHFRAHAWMRTALYRKMGLPSRFGSGWEGEVLARLRKVEDRDFRTVLNVLKAGEKVVAAQFGMISRGVMHWWFPAYAETAARYSPGIGLIDFCAREASEEGVTTIDFGRGDERYKRFFASGETPLLAGSIARRGSAAAVLRRVAHEAAEPLERLLPSSMEQMPRQIAGRLVNGVGIPRYG